MARACRTGFVQRFLGALDRVSWGRACCLAFVVVLLDVVGPGSGGGGCDCGGEDVVVDYIEISPAPADVRLGETVQFVAETIYTDGSRFEINPVWSSADVNIVTIDQTGLATPVAVGETRIEAGHLDFYDWATITVRQ